MNMKFKCTLLSDLVLNETSSSEGKQRCLDFIPGNNFLGILNKFGAYSHYLFTQWFVN